MPYPAESGDRSRTIHLAGSDATDCVNPRVTAMGTWYMLYSVTSLGVEPVDPLDLGLAGVDAELGRVHRLDARAVTRP